MLFSSLIFLLWFLPPVVLLHLLLPAKARNALLFCASVLFYAWGEIRYVPLVLASMLVNHFLGSCCASARPGLKKAAFALSLAVNFGALGFFKYAGFFLETLGLPELAPDLPLPLGISFYTFQTQAYVVDVYRGKIKPDRSLVDYGAFVLLFPQLIAGPIVLYTDISRELKRRTLSAEGLEEGVSLFITGLAYKVLLANPLGALWEGAKPAAASSSLAAWLGIIAFGLQIYFDFAGYSLMALGMGRMLGFRFPRNFDRPYAAWSVRGFWQRWHMTLSSWFRDYVYIPLGGNRRGKARTLLNLLFVWGLTGLWHGASWNFVVWGLWFFVFLALERAPFGGWLDAHRLFGRAYTLLVVLLGWVLFALESLPEALSYAGRMFGGGGAGEGLHLLRNNAVLLPLAVACCVPAVGDRVRRLFAAHAPFRACALFVTLALCVAALVNSDYNPFLYFRF